MLTPSPEQAATSLPEFLPPGGKRGNGALPSRSSVFRLLRRGFSAVVALVIEVRRVARLKRFASTKPKPGWANTGWTGSAFGVGARIKLKYTRRIIDAMHNAGLRKVDTID